MIMLILFVVTSCDKQAQAQEKSIIKENVAAVVSVVAEPLEIAKKALPKLLDLGAHKCIPCQKMAPILKELTSTYEGQMEVEFIDVWQDQTAGKKYGIRTIPTQIFYGSDGKELFRHEGFFSKEKILSKWAEFGYKFPEKEPSK